MLRQCVSFRCQASVLVLTHHLVHLLIRAPDSIPDDSSKQASTVSPHWHTFFSSLTRLLFLFLLYWRLLTASAATEVFCDCLRARWSLATGFSRHVYNNWFFFFFFSSFCRTERATFSTKCSLCVCVCVCCTKTKIHTQTNTLMVMMNCPLKSAHLSSLARVC